MSLNAAGYPHAGFAAAEITCTKGEVEAQQCAASAPSLQTIHSDLRACAYRSLGHTVRRRHGWVSCLGGGHNGQAP
jgi:hypothetical protein